MEAPASSHIIWLLLLASLLVPTVGWIVPQPKVNVWTTLARSLGQDHICLSSTSSTSPISTCLVGIPFTPEEFPKSILFHQAQANSMKAAFKLVQAGEFFRQVKLHVVNPLLLWSEWVDTFLELDREAQGLELMGSAAAA